MSACPTCHREHVGPRSSGQFADLLRDTVRRSLSFGREALNFLRVQIRLTAGEIEGLCANCSWQKAHADIGNDARPPDPAAPPRLVVIDGGACTTDEEYAAASGEPIEPWMRVTHDGEKR